MKEIITIKASDLRAKGQDYILNYLTDIPEMRTAESNKISCPTTIMFNSAMPQVQVFNSVLRQAYLQGTAFVVILLEK